MLKETYYFSRVVFLLLQIGLQLTSHIPQFVQFKFHSFARMKMSFDEKRLIHIITIVHSFIRMMSIDHKAREKKQDAMKVTLCDIRNQIQNIV